MSEPKWHISPTKNGKQSGRTHYDIGAADNENIALVYPAEDGDDVTVDRARLFANARETKRQRDMLLTALREVVELSGLPFADHEYGMSAIAVKARAAIAECEE